MAELTMKTHITPAQLNELSEGAQIVLEKWYRRIQPRLTRECVHVYVPAEDQGGPGEQGGIFEGYWDDEQDFAEYTGKLKNYQDTVLPLMDVTLLWLFLDFMVVPHPQQTVDELWTAAAAILEELA